MLEFVLQPGVPLEQPGIVILLDPPFEIAQATLEVLEMAEGDQGFVQNGP
jgi:hypothetical protein